MADTSGGAQVVPARALATESRINALPDDLLFRAISHLDARQVVQTCVLSRRWRDLWRSVPRINASRHEFDGLAATEEERDAMFKKFVSRFLMLRNPVAMDEFRLCYSLPGESDDTDADSADANLWIGHALQCNARSVEVTVWLDRLDLDSGMFTSEYLTSLQLSCLILHPGFFTNVQKGCTKLERLLLHDCAIWDFEICSQTLKILAIDEDCFFTYHEQPSVSIPSLIYLDFFACERVPVLNNMESLVTASVSVGTTRTQVDDIGQFLMSLSGVTVLDFSYTGKTLKMENDLQWCPSFNNLTTLILGEWCIFSDSHALIVFLHNTPNLVKLTLKMNKLVSHSFSRFMGDLKDISFTLEHLEIIEVVCPEGDSVLSLEKLLLECGVTSDQMDIKHLESHSIVLTLRV